MNNLLEFTTEYGRIAVAVKDICALSEVIGASGCSRIYLSICTDEARYVSVEGSYEDVLRRVEQAMEEIRLDSLIRLPPLNCGTGWGEK